MYGKILKRPLHKTDDHSTHLTIQQRVHRGVLNSHERDLQKLILNLTVYRASLCQQIGSLEAWAQRDEAETKLEQLQIYDAAYFYEEQIQMLRSQLQDLARKYQDQQGDKTKNNIKNESNAAKIRLAMDQRDKYQACKHAIDKQNSLLLERIKAEKSQMQAQTNNNQGIKKRINEIEMQVNNLKQKMQVLEDQKNRKESQIKLKQQLTKSETHRNKLKQNQISGLKANQEGGQLQFIQLNKENQVKRLKLSQLYTTLHITSAQSDAESYAGAKIQSNFDDCLKSLQTKLASLQFQDRARQQLQDKISVQRSKREKNTSQVQRLSEYITQLQAVNKNMTSLLSKYSHEDRVQANKLQLKMQQKQKSYEFETMLRQSNIMMEKKFEREVSRSQFKQLEKKTESKQPDRKDRPLLEISNCRLTQHKQSRTNHMPNHITQIIKKYRGTYTDDSELEHRSTYKTEAILRKNQG